MFSAKGLTSKKTWLVYNLSLTVSAVSNRPNTSPLAIRFALNLKTTNNKNNNNNNLLF